LQNLKIYLDYLLIQDGKRLLFVGEAPGYKGCAITGIPFTSGMIFERFEHPLLTALHGQIELPRVMAEKTATMVWEYLSVDGFTPLFWNSFPFHPHEPEKLDSNRCPLNEEIEIGVKFIKQLVQLYQPDLIAAIGKKGMRGLKRAFPGTSFECIRHPSNGGKKQFIRDMNRIRKR
jgi:uracil-DNA glycosylase